MSIRSKRQNDSDALPLPMTPQEVKARGWDCRGCGVCHRRRLCGSSEFRDGAVGPGVGSRRFSRGHSQPARLAFLRCLENFRAAASVLCHQCRQHGLDAQPLHGQPQGPQRRRLQSRRADRSAAGSGDDGLLPAGTRGVQGRADHRRRRRSQSATAGPLRLLERQGPPLDHPRRQGRSGRLRHGRTAAGRNRQTAGRRRIGSTASRHSRRGVSAGGE